MKPLQTIAIGAALCASAAMAQAPAGGTRAAATGRSSASSAAASADASKVAREDSRMMSDLAEANIAEVETGKLALEKTRSDQVKSFAQQMVDDHGTALKELQTLAQSKGVKLPDGTDLQHKATATALRALSGDTFDKQYIKRAGVNDHERTLKLLQKMQKDGKDADLKALAAKMQPTVEKHLQMAQQMEKASEKK